MKKKAELLAPAGNMDSLKAAVEGGCDAVFLGLQSFSARAFAGNFSHEEFIEAVRYCHVRNVSVYVTINTMLFEYEIENAKKEVAFLYEHDCDALLIQDLGLFHYVRTCYPDFAVHCSTQMHIHNIAGVKYMHSLGAERIVLARETPIEIVREACSTGAEIEVFAYGAICISYSGQCLMSEAMKHRSANRGMCAQCCRLRYYPERGSRFEEGDYILSPKDLSTIERLPELLDAGVSSLKIEGRMKRPGYVYLVTRVFREAIDAWAEGRSYHLSKEHERELMLMFNRGFSDGHLFHSTMEERMSQFRPNHRGLRIGTVADCRNGKVRVKLTAPLYQHDGLRVINEPEDIGLTAVKIEKDGKLVNEAKAGDTVLLDCRTKPFPRKGQPLYKTSDYRLLTRIDNEIAAKQRKVNVTMQYEAFPDAPLVLTVSDERGNTVTAVSEQDCQHAQKAPLSHEKLCANLMKTGDLPYTVTGMNGEIGNVFMPVSIINDTRRRALEELTAMRETVHQRKGIQPYAFTLAKKQEPAWRVLVQANAAHEENRSDVRTFVYGENDGCVLPVVRESETDAGHMKDCIISQAADLSGTHENCIAGMTLNLANSYALAFVLSISGIDGAVFSSEISNDQIEITLNAFRERYGFTPHTYRLVYGHRTVMYVKNGFMNDTSRKFMVDMHGNRYDLAYNNGVALIHEPDLFRSENPHCYGSLILQDNDGREIEAVKEDIYEELHEGI